MCVHVSAFLSLPFEISSELRPLHGGFKVTVHNIKVFFFFFLLKNFKKWPRAHLCGQGNWYRMYSCFFIFLLLVGVGLCRAFSRKKIVGSVKSHGITTGAALMLSECHYMYIYSVVVPFLYQVKQSWWLLVSKKGSLSLMSVACVAGKLWVVLPPSLRLSALPPLLSPPSLHFA